MIGYPFIEALFKNILVHSAGIAGRVLLCPKMGREINADDLYQAIQDGYATGSPKKKYPIALIMPPVGFGDVAEVKQGWERTQIILFFLKQQYQEGVGQMAQPNPNTRTSTHTIVMDWHDMKRCALDFLATLQKLIKHHVLQANKIRLNHSYDYKVTPVSDIGADRLAGVRLEFFIDINVGCPLEDYDATDYKDVTLPADDPHPIHPL